MTLSSHQTSHSIAQIFSKAYEIWNLEELYTDLTKAKQFYRNSQRQKLTRTEKSHLRGLLQGFSPKEIADRLNRNRTGLRVDLCRGLYRYIETLTDQQLIHWREIPELLKAYRRSGIDSEPAKLSLVPESKLLTRESSDPTQNATLKIGSQDHSAAHPQLLQQSMSSPYLYDPERVTVLPDHTQLPESDGTFVKNFQEHPQSVLLTDSLQPILEQLHPDGQYTIGHCPFA